MKSSRPAPTTRQGIFGVVVLLVLSVIPFLWSIQESGSNLVFLWLLSGLFLTLALFRAYSTYRMAQRRKAASGS